MLIGHDAYMESESERSQRLLALLGGLCSLDLFGTAELRKRGGGVIISNQRTKHLKIALPSSRGFYAPSVVSVKVSQLS